MKTILLLLALHAADTMDGYSTNWGIRKGYIREANPIYRPFAGHRTMYVTENIGSIGEDLIYLKLRKKHRKLAKIFYGSCLAADGVLVEHNFTLRPRKK